MRRYTQAEAREMAEAIGRMREEGIELALSEAGLREKLRKAQAVMLRLMEWARDMGGWEAPIWIDVQELAEEASA